MNRFSFTSNIIHKCLATFYAFIENVVRVVNRFDSSY